MLPIRGIQRDVPLLNCRDEFAGLEEATEREEVQAVEIDRACGLFARDGADGLLRTIVTQQVRDQRYFAAAHEGAHRCTRAADLRIAQQGLEAGGSGQPGAPARVAPESNPPPSRHALLR